MELLFRYPVEGDGIDYVIDHVCRGSEVPVHAEIRFSDGRCFSSRAPVGPGWVKSIDTTTNSPKWDVVPLPWNETEHAIKFCDSIVGCDYDYLGAGNSGFHISIRDANKWFCSQTCIEILSRCGVFGIPPMLNPAGLQKYIQQMLAGENQKTLSMCPEFNYLEK
jgi:hypothetical protein